MRCKTAFLTTIFPMEKSYLIDFFNSLQSQTYKDFDVIVVNDGCEYFQEMVTEFSLLNIIELKFSDTPAKNREFGIKYVKDARYDVLIFGDSDDYFSPNRVKVCIDKLKLFDIVVNDLTIFNKDGISNNHYISNRIKNNTPITLDYIENKNIFGMSNTSVKVSVINDIIFDEKLLAVDWYFFSLLLSKTHTAVFTNDATSYYRQHENNAIGLGKITNESILKGVLVKKRHYELMQKENIRFNELLLGICELEMKVKNIQYIEKLKKQSVENYLWWEEIKLL